MQIEQIEIFDFYQRFSPFKELPENILADVARQTQISYFKAGQSILSFNDPIDALYVVRSGAVETFRRTGELYNRLSEGGFFGEMGLLQQHKVRFPATALEDSLLYLIPDAVFMQLFSQFEHFADYVEVDDHTRLKTAVARYTNANELMTAKVSTLIQQPPIMLDQAASVQQAAQLMTEHNVSALLITQQLADSSPHLCGIITDQDLRTRVIAQNLALSTPVAQVMSSDLIRIEHHQFVFEAMMLMLRHQLQHLPILKQDRPIGMITMSDMVRYESQNSLYVVNNIFRQSDVEGLANLKADVQACFLRMVHEDANSQMIGAAMAAIGRSFKQRLLELAEQQLGAPPVPYCFLALGSMARDEQLIVTDQDNALVLHPDFDPKQHDAYFAQLAQFVCDGLNACGYPYCTGQIMATNPQWRQPLPVWQNYFQNWITQPTPEKLLHSGIFFDLDGVWGQVHWAKQLNEQIKKQAQQQPRFLACMAKNALSRTPPLGFFQDFVMETDGRQQHTLNIKRRGTAPMADLIRIHALAIGATAKNSFERLDAIIAANILPQGRGQDLHAAMEIISMVRIRHQALALRAGQVADNAIQPEQLSEFERKTLKDAFKVLSDAQRFLKFHYQSIRIS
ncbi:MAG: DUF294 nucleotidyltransferase-like domain-containing protein [Pseudomonadota bacterium]|nr:DUF294 nucleotidyltransferase-like domain-containing protein [Pseudomonadota bacterium]